MGVSPAGDADADGVADAADPNDMGEGAEESTVSTQTGATIDEGEAMPAAPVAGADADPAAPGEGLRLLHNQQSERRFFFFFEKW